jgi:hypothetical protein
VASGLSGFCAAGFVSFFVKMLASLPTPYGAVENVANAPMMYGRLAAHIDSLSEVSDIACLAMNQIKAMEDTDNHPLITRAELGVPLSLKAAPSHDRIFCMLILLPEKD